MLQRRLQWLTTEQQSILMAKFNFLYIKTNNYFHYNTINLNFIVQKQYKFETEQM